MILRFDWQVWVEDWKRCLLDFKGKVERWHFWGDAQAGFESLDLMSEGTEKEKLLQFVGETEMEDLGVVDLNGELDLNE